MKTPEQKIKYHIEQIKKAIEEEKDQTFTMWKIWQMIDAISEMLTGKKVKK